MATKSRKDDGNWHFLAEVGSASNWVLSHCVKMLVARILFRSSAVKCIFSTIAKSVSAKKGSWQCIILDHADSNIYGDIEGIHEVIEWRNGKKLIPEEWCS